MRACKQAIIPGVRAHKHANTQELNHGKNAGMQASQAHDLEDLLMWSRKKFRKEASILC